MAKESLAGERRISPRRVEDLVLWEAEPRYCRTSVVIEGPLVLEVGTVLVDAVPSASAAAGLQPAFSDSISLRNVTIGSGETAEVPALVRGPALLNLDEVVRATSSENDTDLKTRLADLRAQGVRFVRDPQHTNDSPLAPVS